MLHTIDELEEVPNATTRDLQAGNDQPLQALYEIDKRKIDPTNI